MPPATGPRSFWQKSDDLRCREWPCRVTRFLRARVRQCCTAGLRLADDPRVIQAWRRGWEPNHFVRLRRWQAEGFHPEVVFDVGAHDGLWSEMCRAVFTPRQIYLFEPQPEHQAVARARGPAAGPGWQVVPVALGETEQGAVMHVTGNTAASSLLPPLEGEAPAEWGMTAVRKETVRVATLDGLVTRGELPVPDLVKIDVQGFERHVLAGGRNVLPRAKRIIVEVSLRAMYHGQALMPEILHILDGYGFALDDLNETCREWGGTLWQADLWLKRRP